MTLLSDDDNNYNDDIDDGDDSLKTTLISKNPRVLLNRKAAERCTALRMEAVTVEELQSQRGRYAVIER